MMKTTVKGKEIKNPFISSLRVKKLDWMKVDHNRKDKYPIQWCGCLYRALYPWWMAPSGGIKRLVKTPLNTLLIMTIRVRLRSYFTINPRRTLLRTLPLYHEKIEQKKFMYGTLYLKRQFQTKLYKASIIIKGHNGFINIITLF